MANISQTARHEQIVELVNAKGFVSVEDLASHFDVTPQTMRRDINTLAAENRVRRFHGGASASRGDGQADRGRRGGAAAP